MANLTHTITVSMTPRPFYQWLWSVPIGFRLGMRLSADGKRPLWMRLLIAAYLGTYRFQVEKSG